jgi:hypothetical protein
MDYKIASAGETSKAPIQYPGRSRRNAIKSRAAIDAVRNRSYIMGVRPRFFLQKRSQGKALKELQCRIPYSCRW